VELWGITRSLPEAALAAGKQAEDEGWTGLCFSDSQNRSADPYVAMTLVAQHTSRLRVSTGVTNPTTRHPAVTASAIASVQLASRGRAELGIGRGDSSLAYLGMAPAPVSVFEEYVRNLAAYLRGESVPNHNVDAVRTLHDGVPLADVAVVNRLEWLEPAGVPQVPLWAVASGPKVIDAASASADRVLLAVGASRERLAWGIARARAARPHLLVGAYVNVLVGDDREQLRRAASGGIAGLARFGAMHGKAVGAMSARDQQIIESIPARYDMTRHFQSSNDAAALPPDFIDEFAILGSAAEVIDRIDELAELGIDRLHVLGPSNDVPVEEATALRRAFIRRVLPEVVTARSSS
jgi:5,10-methylenetetrahydromethanopterin reductase